jgi:hypothetical protein
VSNSGSSDLVFGFAFCVEVAAVDVVYDRNGEVLHLKTAKGFSQAASASQNVLGYATGSLTATVRDSIPDSWGITSLCA